MQIVHELKNFFVPSVKSCRRPRAFTHKWLTWYSIGLVLSQLALGVSYYSGSTLITEDTNSMAKNIISLTNTQRNENELESLKENELLNKAASAKLQDMFTNDYWDHFSPQGKKPWDFISESNYSYIYAGENLAKGFVDSGSTVNAWMDSPTHKNNLLSSRYSEIGVAVGSGYLNNKPTTLIVQMFGTPENKQIAEKVENPIVLGVKEDNKAVFNPLNATLPARIPYFIIWFIIFGLIVFDGAMLRKCGLHHSRKHLFEFRSALIINSFALVLLFMNFAAIA